MRNGSGGAGKSLNRGWLVTFAGTGINLAYVIAVICLLIAAALTFLMRGPKNKDSGDYEAKRRNPVKVPPFISSGAHGRI